MEPVKQTKAPRVKMPEAEASVRIKDFEEVNQGLTEELAKLEAQRCLQCKKYPCVEGCPVQVNIPGFIGAVAEGDFAKAARLLKECNALPAICGRVCPQETQCEAKCVRGVKGQPVAIGWLERFVADWALRNNGQLSSQSAQAITPNGHKVAVVGSGPGGLTCAGELAKMGYDVTVL